MSKQELMFKLWKDERIETVNPFNGCLYGCYHKGCWARRRAKRLRAAGTKGYENGFEPTPCPYRMEVPRADIVWIGSMGDISFQAASYVRRIIEEMIKPYPNTLFLLESKNPQYFSQILGDLPENVMLSTTIETNKFFRGVYEGKAKVPSPHERYQVFRNLDWPKKHVSIEPLMRFDIGTLVRWMRKIQPDIVSVGYDNHNCGLPEPKLSLAARLVMRLRGFTKVEIKSEEIRKKVNEL